MKKIKYCLASYIGLVELCKTEAEKHAAERLFLAMQEYDGLTFGITTNKEGWMAKCVDIQSIITGGIETDDDLSQEVVDEMIKDAIFTAFKLPTRLSDFNFIERSEKLKKVFENSTSRCC